MKEYFTRLNNISIAFLLTIASAQAVALQEGKISGATVTEIYLDARERDDGNPGRFYGGCLVELSTPPSTIDASCLFGKVTLLCDGATGAVTKAAAGNNLSAAQLALATGNQVDVWVNPNINIDGACAATGIWNKD